ncbi:hypothetical protein SRHO_G00161550 [Serrasalmus rhombeus]
MGMIAPKSHDTPTPPPTPVRAPYQSLRPHGTRGRNKSASAFGSAQVSSRSCESSSSICTRSGELQHAPHRAAARARGAFKPWTVRMAFGRVSGHQKPD